MNIFSARLGLKRLSQGGPRGGMCPPLIWGFEGGESPLAPGENLVDQEPPSLAQKLVQRLDLKLQAGRGLSSSLSIFQKFFFSFLGKKVVKKCIFWTFSWPLSLPWQPLSQSFCLFSQVSWAMKASTKFEVCMSLFKETAPISNFGQFQ